MKVKVTKFLVIANIYKVITFFRLPTTNVDTGII